MKQLKEIRIERRESFDDSRNGLVRPNEKGENWIRWYELDPTKDYLCGRLNILVEFQVHMSGQRQNFYAVFRVNHTDVMGLGHDLSTHNDVYIGNARHRYRNKNCCVFVSYIEQMERVEKRISSVVWLHVGDELDDLWSGHIYTSVSDSLLKSVLRFNEWELSCPIIDRRSSCELNRENIKRAMEVMNCVSDDQWNVLRDLFALPEDKSRVAGLRIYLGLKSIRLSVAEGLKDSVKLRDMFLGPLNL